MPKENENDRLLSSQERAACQAIAAQGEAPHSQRALALLAVDNGAKQAEVMAQSGLSLGQLKYCLTKFRAVRLGIFPDSPTPTAKVTATELAENEDKETTGEKEAKKSKKGKKAKDKVAGKKKKEAKKQKKDNKKSGKKKKAKKG